ncbi:MAG: AEC family transporter [Bacillota bacterium]|nr:AEC family transporter [Bacillota bacterium]
MDAFLFSFNAVFPIFVLMALGFALKRLKVIDDNFIDTGAKLMFNAALPCMLFLDILHTNVTEVFDLRLLIFAVTAVCVAVGLMLLIVPRLIKDPYSYTAFIQGSFRSNFAIIGIALVSNISGSSGVAVLAMMLCFIGPLFNILSVLVLARNQNGEAAHHPWRSIITNPLLIGILIGTACSLLRLQLPPLIEQPLQYLSDIALPLSLITLGGAIEFKHGDANIRLAVIAALIKTVLLPLLMVPAAIVCGIDGVSLAVVLVLFGAPAAVSSFPMAHQMGGDYKLAAMIVAFTNIFCIATLFAFIYAMRVWGLL